MEEEIQKLKNENELLKIQLESSFEKLKFFESDPFPSITVAKTATESFTKLNPGGVIKIPVAFLFDSVDLGSLTTRHPFVRFYASIRPDTEDKFTLSAVGVDANNNDVITPQPGQTHLPIFEFADPCPPCLINGEKHKTNPVLYIEEIPDGTFYTFIKQ